jgi:hypothetical protein
VARGGALSGSCHLGTGTTHAVCALPGDHAAATMLRYSALGLHVVTPPWVLSSLSPTGAAASTVSVSRDAARLLAAAHAALSAACEKTPRGLLAAAAAAAAGAASVGATPRGDGGVPGEEPACGAMDTAAREALVRQAKAERRSKHEGGVRGTLAPLQPPALLQGFGWAVDEPAEAAVVFRDDDEGAQQQSVTDYELDAVVYRAPFLTLLFPLDRFCEGVQGVRVLHCPPLHVSAARDGARGLTRRRLLEEIHAFYAEQLTEHETRLALFTDSVHADGVRVDYAAGGERWRRVALLGSLKNLDGLRRVSASTYELLLTA